MNNSSTGITNVENRIMFSKCYVFHSPVVSNCFEMKYSWL